MEFKLTLDPSQPEVVTAAVHARSELTAQIAALSAFPITTYIQDHLGGVVGEEYARDEVRQLPFSQIECLTVIDGKTWAIDRNGDRCRVKMRLYELEAILPACFIRINKSTLANERRLERFVSSFSGAVDAVFQCGWREYVSRRCFAHIKRRFSI